MTVVIIGVGDVGHQIASTLEHRRDMRLVLIDSDDEKCKRLAERMDALVISGDASDPEILQELKPDSELNPRVATFALFGMINWVYTWYKPGRDVPLDRLVEELMQLFLHGYLAEQASAHSSGAGLRGIGEGS